MTEESEAPPNIVEMVESVAETQAANDRRRNRWLNAWNDARIQIVQSAAVCGIFIVIAASVVLILTLSVVTIDHTLNDELLSTDQMRRIRSTMIGFRDWLSGSAFLSSAVLFFLARRGWIMPVGRSDDTDAS